MLTNKGKKVKKPRGLPRKPKENCLYKYGFQQLK
jgi:hypothetical protein